MILVTQGPVYGRSSGVVVNDRLADVALALEIDFGQDIPKKRRLVHARRSRTPPQRSTGRQ